MFEMAYLVPAMIWSALGMGMIMYGRRAPSITAGVGGVLLLLEPCVLFTPWVLWVAGGTTLAAVWGAGRFLEDR